MTTLMLDRDVKSSSKTTPSLDFVPVIFANGIDDDLPGIAAAIRNERVQFEEKIYKPFEEMVIRGRDLAVSCNRIIIRAYNDTEYEPGPGEVVIRQGLTTRPIFIENCTVYLNIKVGV